jgi:sucrose-6-phosphate hydrolase SacC (GH32 family)
MNLSVTAGFLWLPISRASPAVKLHFLSEKVKFREIDIALDPDHPEYYAAMDLRKYTGSRIEIRGNLPDGMLAKLRFHDEQPDMDCPCRPLIHFTAPGGWINDPNGLVYADGIWHLYFQWNPYGTEWGNMHWGHAVSRDLITWEHKGIVMEPDEFGTVFSGCGYPDHDNAAGFGKDTLLFFYTASGGCNQWSVDAGNRHTQHLAVSEDGGETLLKKGLILDHIKGGNRDPKVFYHSDSKAYIMVLFLDDDEFALFRSPDLIHWKESQRFSVPGMRECPDLFELPVDNEPSQKKWVFWSADGFYLTGHFDGYRFDPESEMLSAYATKLPYAAQTYAGVSDRKISIAWMRTENDRGNFRGMLSVPAELSLFGQNGRYRIRFRPVRELWDSFRVCREYSPNGNSLILPLTGKPVIAEIIWKPGQEKTVTIGKTGINTGAETDRMLLLVDHGILEYWTNDGLVCGAVETDMDVLSDRMEIRSGAESIRIFEYCR